MGKKILVLFLISNALLAGQGQVAWVTCLRTPAEPAGGTSRNPVVTANLLLLADAVSAARARIAANRRCQRFFNDQGPETIERTHYSFQDLGPGDRAAQVDDDVVFLNVNPRGKFLSPPQNYAGLTTSVEIRGFFILHELGHELSKFTRFQPDQSPSRQYSRLRHDLNDALLQQNCY